MNCAPLFIARRELACPACGADLAVRAAGFSVAVLCPHCGTELGLADPDRIRIGEVWARAGSLPLPLGHGGVLRGIEREVLGSMTRSNAQLRWNEYLLFNPYHGFAWLMEDAGEWWLGTILAEPPGDGWFETWTYRDCIYFANKAFRDWGLIVEQIAGEFHIQPHFMGQARETRYFALDEWLRFEIAAEESQWTHFSRLDSEECRHFGIEGAD